MAWYLTEEQEMARDSIREWVRREVAPVAAELDKSDAFPMELFKRAGELGFIGLTFPQKYGGSGMSFIMQQVVSEEVGKELPSLAMAIGVHCGVSAFALYFGSDEQKKYYLPKAATGEWIFATNSVGPEGATNFTEPTTIGTRIDGEIILNTEFPYATNGMVADVYNIVGMVDGAPVNVFIEKCDGIIPATYDIMGMHNLGFASVSYKDVHVPAIGILQQKPIPSLNAVAWLNYGANYLGALEAVIERTTAFVMNRSRMGKPLGTYQGPAHVLAEARIVAEAIRGMVGAGAASVDRGEVDLVTCFATKAYAMEAAPEAIRRCIELFGGVGVVEETGVIRFLRDAITMAPGELSEQTLLDIIAQHIGLPVETQLDIYCWPDVNLD